MTHLQHAPRECDHMPLAAVPPVEFTPAAADAERIAFLRAKNFSGPTFEALREDLWGYAMPVLRDALRTGRIVRMCRDRGIFVSLHTDDRQALHTSAVERDTLAVDTLVLADRYFRKSALQNGRWNASIGASLRTYFVGTCLLKFPDAYATWSRQRRDRAVAAYYGVAIPERLVPVDADDPGTVVVQRELVATLVKDATPTTRAILTKVLEGKTYAEIGCELGLSARAVEGHVYRLRRRVRLLTDGSRSPRSRRAS